MPKKNEVNAVALETSKQVEEKTKVEINSSPNNAYVACSLQLGIKYKILTKDGSIKEVVFPGISQQSRDDNNGGILLDRGSSVLVTLPKEDWDAVKEQYASHYALSNVPPFLRELDRKEDYQSKELQSELKEIRTGNEPLIPNPTEEEQKTEQNTLVSNSKI